MEQNVTFFLSLIIEQDKNSGDYTASYAQFPEAIAQGRTKEEATKLLDEILPYALEGRKEEFFQYHNTDVEITQKPFYAVVA